MHVIPEWLQLISLTFLIGALVCRLWVFTPSTCAEFPQREDFISGMWSLFCTAIAVMVAGSVVELLVRTVEISGQPVSHIFSVLPTVLLRTHYGKIWLVRIAALMLLSTLKVAGRYRDSRTFLSLMLFFALVVSMTASASGHASDAGDLSLPELMDWLHLIAASVWGGGLFVLSVSILPNLAGQAEKTPLLVAGVARRFSAMAGIAVGIAALTALYNAWVYVGGAAASWETPYGVTAALKIALFIILVSLGAFNRYISVPLLQEWAGGSSAGRGILTGILLRFFPRLQLGGKGELIASRFRRSVRIEAILVLGVLLCAAFLRHDIPARHARHLMPGGGTGTYHMHEGDEHMDHDRHQ